MIKPLNNLLSKLSVQIWKTLSLSPSSIKEAIASLIAHVVISLNLRRIRIAKKNISLCFPALDSGSQNKLLQETIKSSLLGFLDIGFAWWASPKIFQSKIKYTNLSHFTDALKSNKGIILYTGHFAPLDVGARAISLLTPTYTLYRPNESVFLEDLIIKNRNAYSSGAIPRDNMRHMIKALKNKKAVWYAPDQNYGLKNSVFSYFMGVLAATSTATTKIASLSDAIVLPFKCVRTKDGYEISFKSIIENFHRMNPSEGTQLLNNVLSDMVKEHPEQYNWIHRRFKDTPDGTNFYK